MNILEIRKRILRPILLPMAFSAIGFAVAFIFKRFLHFELDKLEISIIAFVVTTLSVLYLFPKIYKIPFGKVSVKEWIFKVGLYKPEHTFKYIILGLILATITLSGMLFASFQIGGYKPDLSQITLGQAIFSLTPGIWEEILFRGVLMIALLHLTKSLKKASIIQVLLFGLAHIKGIDLLSFIDAFFVVILAISFTYVTFKSKSLIPAIIFHYLHDTFIFFVQLPDSKYIGFTNNAIFYIVLLISIILTMFVTRKSVERFNIHGNFDFYAVEGLGENNIHETKSSGKRQSKNRSNKIILILNAALFSSILLTNYNETDLIIALFYIVFIIINIFLFIFYSKYSRNIKLYINIINAFIAFITSYDLFMQGSQTVYFIWIILGFVNLLVTFLSIRKKKYLTKKENVKNE